MTPLDRVIGIEPGRAASAVRNVPATLDVFDHHFPRFPVLPGVLILDDVVTVAGLALPSGGWQLAGANRVRYRHFVRPGDELEIEVTVKDASADTAVCSASARVSGKTVTTIRELHLRRVAGAEAI
jgi:3-hydroxyacyl-[acyl-carrier-protein] dehydratase